MNRRGSASIAHSTPRCPGAPQVSTTRRHCRRCALQFPGQRLPQTQEPERRFPEWLSFAYGRRAKVVARCARIIAGSLSAQMNYWEIIADNLSKAGWSWSCIAAADRDGRTIWIADAYRDNGKRFVVRSKEKMTAFLELERITRESLRFQNAE